MNLSDMPNKQFAFACINMLLDAGKLDEHTLRLLMDSEECKERFHCVRSTAILKTIPNHCSESELTKQCNDGTNQSRYYKAPISINGQDYIITNYWYGANTRMPDNRTPFMEWVHSKI